MKRNYFQVVLGKACDLINGLQWNIFYTELVDDKIELKNTKTLDKNVFEISSIENPSIYYDNGSLWFDCTINGNELLFTSPKRYWESSALQSFVDRVSPLLDSESLKIYKKYIKRSIIDIFLRK